VPVISEGANAVVGMLDVWEKVEGWPCGRGYRWMVPVWVVFGVEAVVVKIWVRQENAILTLVYARV